jgi:hypothetical protein
VIGTAEGLRLLSGRVGEGARGELGNRRGDGGVLGGGGGAFLKLRKNGKGIRDLSGGWRRLRYMLKFRSARFAWGTYLDK